MRKHMGAVAKAVLFLGMAGLIFAQSGDISASTSQVSTLGVTILKLGIALAGMAFVGLLIWGGLTLTTNRPRGLAMIGGGLVGALLAGLSFAIVNTETGSSVPTSELRAPGTVSGPALS